MENNTQLRAHGDTPAWLENESENKTQGPPPPPPKEPQTRKPGDESEAFLTDIDRAMNSALKAVDEMLRVPDRVAFGELPYMEHLRKIWGERQINENDPIWLWVEVVSVQDQRYREHLAKHTEVIFKQAEILALTIRYLRMQVATIEDVHVNSEEILKVTTESVNLLEKFGENGAGMIEGMDAVITDARKSMADHKVIGEKIITAADNIAGISIKSVYVYGFGLGAALVCGVLIGKLFL